MSIDVIADKLVNVLSFIGIVLRIPSSIMGLTVLAWGNSMADLSANVTMARKGLANMAITVSELCQLYVNIICAASSNAELIYCLGLFCWSNLQYSCGSRTRI